MGVLMFAKSISVTDLLAACVATTCEAIVILLSGLITTGAVPWLTHVYGTRIGSAFAG